MIARLQHDFGDLQADEEGTRWTSDIILLVMQKWAANFFFSTLSLSDLITTEARHRSQVLWVRQRTNGLHAFKCIPVYMDYQAGCSGQCCRVIVKAMGFPWLQMEGWDLTPYRGT